MKTKKSKKVKDNKINKNQAYLLYVCFAVTVFLSVNLLLAYSNICYLPLNTTGECVIVRSILPFEHYFLFQLFETIFSGLVTILFLIDGFKYKNKKYLIICFLNILLQPFVIIFILSLIG